VPEDKKLHQAIWRPRVNSL